MADYVTLACEKHALVHFTTYATMEPPKGPFSKKKQVLFVRSGCGKKFQRSEFRVLGPRSKRRFYTCVKCARWELPKEPKMR